MGHASVKQTEVYAKLLGEELDKAMELFNQHGFHTRDALNFEK